MIEVKTQYPYVSDEGIECPNLIKFYAEDENGVRYQILQIETNSIGDEIVETMPYNHSYTATNRKVEVDL